MSMEQQMYADNVALRSELQIEEKKVLFDQGKVLYADKLIAAYLKDLRTLAEVAVEAHDDDCNECPYYLDGGCELPALQYSRNCCQCEVCLTAKKYLGLEA